jgi:hypothetical protein
LDAFSHFALALSGKVALALKPKKMRSLCA